jgi:predicted dienelactone hydrolase
MMKNTLLLILMSFVSTGNVLASDNRVDGLRPDAPELAKAGNHHIGVRTINLVHKNQIDVVNIVEGQALPLYDRLITIEVWYPADTLEKGGVYENVFLRDGKTQVSLYGSAVRDAAPKRGEQKYPLVIISHGYPGNRYLMSHFGENLASKGYVVASIDHTDSMYQDAGAFGSTLLNRPRDHNFVLNEIERMSGEKSHFLHELVDTDKTGLIGYSMGGYGAVITGGGGISQTNITDPRVSPEGILSTLQSGSDTHEALMDDRFKAIVAIAPWVMKSGFWDDVGLKKVRTPFMFISGSVDDVSGYEDGTKDIFNKTINIDRYLLTFENANHNAAAPIPAPAEAWNAVYNSGNSVAFSHYADPVWDTLRMNNIAEHFTSAYFGKYLKNDITMDSYLHIIKNADEGVYVVEEDGNFKPEHTYWKGFQNRTAKGLTLEYLPKK